MKDQVTAALRKQAVAPRLLVFFMGSVPHVDLAGAELLADLRETLRRQGIEFRLAETRGPVREALRRLGSLTRPHWPKRTRRLTMC